MLLLLLEEELDVGAEDVAMIAVVEEELGETLVVTGELVVELEDTDGDDDDEPPVTAAEYSTTLLNELSLTHRFPDGSNASPYEPPMSVDVALKAIGGLAVMLGCPRTKLAFSKFLKGGSNLSTLEKPASAAQSEPDLSKARANGNTQKALGTTVQPVNPPYL